MSDTEITFAIEMNRAKACSMLNDYVKSLKYDIKPLTNYRNHFAKNAVLFILCKDYFLALSNKFSLILLLISEDKEVEQILLR